MRVAVFASGGGSNFRTIAEHCRRGDLPGVEVVLLVTNNSGSGAAAWARANGIEVQHVSDRTHPRAEDRERALLSLLECRRVDLLVLAGYMKLLPPAVVRRWAHSIVNIHPALLPRHGGVGMYGIRVHEAVLAAGDTVTGVTVHLADERYDEGRVLAQRMVPVLPGDTPQTLQARVLEQEHDLYWRVIGRLAREREGC